MKTEDLPPTIFNSAKSINQPINGWRELIGVVLDYVVLRSTLRQDFKQVFQEFFRIIPRGR